MSDELVSSFEANKILGVSSTEFEIIRKKPLFPTMHSKVKGKVLYVEQEIIAFKKSHCNAGFDNYLAVDFITGKFARS